MTATITTRYKLAKYTSAQWTAANPVLLDGEPGFERDTGYFKVGDGVTAWNDLEYAPANLGSSDGLTALEAINRDLLGIKRNSAARVAYDDFRQSNGTLSGKVTPSGHTWATGGTDQSVVAIQDGRVFSSTKGTWYGLLNMGGQTDAVFFDFVFETTGDTPTDEDEKSDRVVLATYDRSVTFPHNLAGHLNIGLEKWSFYPRLNNTSQTVDDDGLATTGNLNLTPGVVYRAGFVQDGDTFTIYLPGRAPIVRTFTNSTTFTADGAFIEGIPAGLAADNYAALGRIVGFSAGDRNVAPGSTNALVTVPNESITRGDNLLTRRGARQFVAASNGWYTLFETAAYGIGYSCLGLIHLSCRASNGGFDRVSYSVTAWTNGSSTKVSLQRLPGRVYRGSPLNSVRISTDGTDKAKVEIYLPSAGSVNVTVDYAAEGLFSPVITPVAVGDPGSALATSTTDTLPTSSLAPITATVSTNDWYRVAIGTAWASFSMGAQLLIVAKSTSSTYATMAVVSVGGRYNQGVALREVWTGYQVNGGAITKVRASYNSGDASNNGLALDFYFPTAASAAVTFTVYPLEGADQLTWVDPPTSGATALATGSKVLTLGGTSGSATYNPASLADGAGVTTTVSVTGAALGDFATATFSNDLQGIMLTAWVSAADTVSVRFQNETGGVIDLASGTLRVKVNPF